MIESCCQFGEHRRLAGVITAPVGASRHVGCVLVNAGLVSKTGPHRLYVDLARRLAGDGIATLRFDLGGIGDSLQAHATDPLPARTALELRGAVDALCERCRDLNGIVVGGLCSGAEDAFRYAELDPRVTGVVLVDPFGYRTAGWWWRNLAHRIIRRGLRAAGTYEPIPTRPKIVNYKFMAHAESSRILKHLIDRRVRVHFIFTGGHKDAFNHERQLRRMFDGIAFEGRVTLDLFGWMDHTQVLASDRRTIANAIGAWLRRSALT